jgi:hypothetical protein
MPHCKAECFHFCHSRGRLARQKWNQPRGRQQHWFLEFNSPTNQNFRTKMKMTLKWNVKNWNQPFLFQFGLQCFPLELQQVHAGLQHLRQLTGIVITHWWRKWNWTKLNNVLIPIVYHPWHSVNKCQILHNNANTFYFL